MPELTVADRYFRWLYDQTGLDREGLSGRQHTPERCYTTVCWHMHQINFLALVPFDENRSKDGAELRKEFERQTGYLEPLDHADLLFPDITILEVLVALAKRAAFMIEGSPQRWFVIFVENLGLDRYTDDYCLIHSGWPIDRRLKTFNNRNYKANGQGGLFPLRIPHSDQKNVELWYQMGAYMTENLMY